MTGSYTRTETITITETRRIAVKIATDLLQLNLFYKSPSIQLIERLADEAAMLLRDRYLGTIQYGFKRAGAVIFMLQYAAGPGGQIDDPAGRVPSGHNLAGASWFSFLTHSPRWDQLTPGQREAYEAGLPIQRTNGEAPTLASGIYYGNAKSYSTDNASVSRSILSTKA